MVTQIDTFYVTDSNGDITLIRVMFDDSVIDPASAVTFIEKGQEVDDYSGLSSNRAYLPGQIFSSQCVGVDLWDISATTSAPFAAINVTPNSATCGGSSSSPPTPTCNLTLVTAASTNATTLAQTEGTITLSVTSGNTPVMFALDGGTPTAGTASGSIISKSFTGLSSGAHTVVVTDALNCVLTETFTIQPFKTNLVATPASGTSRWSALFNPIVFNYQRKDYYIVAVSTSLTGYTDFQISPALTTAQIAAMSGQQVYVSTPDYNFTMVPAGIDNDTNAPNTTVTFHFAINGANTTNAFLNVVGSNPSFKFRTQITSGYDGATNVITADHAPNLKGACRADISKYLRTLLQPKDELDYTAINYRDANISASYTVQFCTVNNNVADGIWQSAGDPFYVTYSAMQIGDPNGGNMLPYVTLPDAGQLTPAKFLNDFTHPRFYTDMPFDLSFIYSEKIAGYQIKLGGNGIDVNGNITGALGEAMLLNENGSVLLNEDGSKLLIEKQAPGVLLSKLGVNRLRITENIPAGSTYVDIFLFYTDGSGNNIPVTESKRLLLDSSPCNGLPYEYLKWMGPSGGWLYYMLIKNQIHEITTSNSVISERFISDYAAADSTQQLISIDAQKKITAGRNDVHMAEAEVLASIIYSPKVYRLVNAATNTWQGVIVDTNSLTLYQTYEGRGDFEISYLLPEVNVQRA